MRLPKSDLTLPTPAVVAVTLAILLLLALAVVALRGGDADLDRRGTAVSFGPSDGEATTTAGPTTTTPSPAASNPAPAAFNPVPAASNPASTPATAAPAAPPASEPAGAPASEPAGAPASEPAGAPASEPAGPPASEPAGPPASPGGEPEATAVEAPAVPLAPLDEAPPAGVGLIAGTCVADDGRASDTASVVVMDCAIEHTGEVFASTVIDQPAEAPFPGADPLAGSARTLCQGTTFSDYVGIPYNDSALFAYFLLPSETTWAAGDRAIACVLYDVTAPLVGTQQGAAR